jgi:hypothetical protein
MTLRIMTASTLSACLLTGCRVDDPLTRVGACVATVHGGRFAGLDSECDLGKRTYLVVLPRNVTAVDLRQLGLPKTVVLSLTAASNPTEPRWCSVTTKAGDLPTQAGFTEGRVVCVESYMEIDRPALLETDAIRIHARQDQDGRRRVTSVESIHH